MVTLCHLYRVTLTSHPHVPMARRPNELRQVMHPGRLRRVPANAGRMLGCGRAPGTWMGPPRNMTTSVTSVIIWNSPIGYIGIIWDYME